MCIGIGRYYCCDIGRGRIKEDFRAGIASCSWSNPKSRCGDNNGEQWQIERRAVIGIVGFRRTSIIAPAREAAESSISDPNQCGSVPRRHQKFHSIDALCGTIASRRRRENDVHQEDRERELPRQAYAAHARLRRRHRVADDAAVVGIEHSNAMSKVHFDGRTREARIGIEGRRMRSFVANSLRP